MPKFKVEMSFVVQATNEGEARSSAHSRVYGPTWINDVVIAKCELVETPQEKLTRLRANMRISAPDLARELAFEVMDVAVHAQRVDRDVSTDDVEAVWAEAREYL